MTERQIAAELVVRAPLTEAKENLENPWITPPTFDTSSGYLKLAAQVPFHEH